MLEMLLRLDQNASELAKLGLDAGKSLTEIVVLFLDNVKNQLN